MKEIIYVCGALIFARDVADRSSLATDFGKRTTSSWIRTVARQRMVDYSASDEPLSRRYGIQGERVYDQLSMPYGRDVR